jgi:O-antigen/teichoic acid export membrane protein
VGSVLSIVYLAILARTLGVAGFGQFALVFGMAQGIMQFTSFQSWRIVVRYGAGHLAAGDRDAFARLAIFATLLDGAAALIGCAIAALAVYMAAPHFGWDREVVRYAVGYAWVMLLAVRSAPMGILRAHDRFRDSAGGDATTPVMRFFGALVVLLVGPSVERFLIAWAVAEIATAMAYWWLALRTGPFAGRRRWSLSRIGEENPGIVRFAWLTNLGSTLTAAQQQLPLLAVGLYAGEAAAGLFRLAHQLGQAMQRLADMLARALFAEQARTHASDGRDAGRILHARISRLVWAAGGLIVLGVLALGYPALLLLGGRAFVAAYPLLILLGIAAALEFVVVGYEPLLLAEGRAGLALAIRAATVAILVAGLAWLVPREADIGAGLSMVAAALAAMLLWRLGAIARD